MTNTNKWTSLEQFLIDFNCKILTIYVQYLFIFYLPIITAILLMF